MQIPEMITYWNNVRRVTLAFLEAFPAEHLGFRPTPEVYTALQQFQHLISSEVMFARGWTDGVWDYPWKDGQWCTTELIDDSFDTLEGLTRFYTDVHARAVRFLSGLPPDAGSTRLATHMGDLSIDGMVLYAVDEEIHHRAQIATYLRMLGIKPPLFAQRYHEL